MQVSFSIVEGRAENKFLVELRSMLSIQHLCSCRHYIFRWPSDQIFQKVTDVDFSSTWHCILCPQFTEEVECEFHQDSCKGTCPWSLKSTSQAVYFNFRSVTSQHLLLRGGLNCSPASLSDSVIHCWAILKVLCTRYSLSNPLFFAV